MSDLYTAVVHFIENRERTKQAEARQLHELVKKKTREQLLKCVAGMMSEFMPHALSTDSAIFLPETNAWAVEVGGIEFSWSVNFPHAKATLLPSVCERGCADTIIEPCDLIRLISRHLSFFDHAEAIEAHSPASPPKTGAQGRFKQPE